MFKALRRALLIPLIFAACTAYPRSAEAAAALIDFVQGALNPAAGVALIGVTGTSVGVTNAVNTGIASWQVDLVYVPTGSGLSISILASSDSGTTPTASFTPDVGGCFRVREQVWSVTNRVGTPADTDIRNFCVPELGTASVVPPYQGAPPRVLTKPDELNFGSQMYGYAGLGTASDGLAIYQMRLAARLTGAATGTIPAGTTGTSLLAAVALANATSCACTIQMGNYTYVLPSPLTMNVSGITLAGNGVGETFVDDSGLSGADAIVVNSVLYFGMHDLTIISPTPRTAGAAIKVLGVNNITHNPAQHTHQYTIQRVNMEDQFVGITFQDGPGPGGAWGGYLSDGEWIRFSAGGTYIDVASTSGGQHYIRDMKLYGSVVADASRAFAAVHYRGGNDLEMVNVNTVYMQHGLVVDPSSGSVANVTICTGCLFDNNTKESILLTQANGGGVKGFEYNGGWAYTPNDGVHFCVSLTGGSQITFTGGKFWDNYTAFFISTSNHVVLNGVDASGSQYGFVTSGGSSNFSIVNSTVGALDGNTPLFGIDITGGDNYIVTGNNVHEASTPINNVPGTSSTRIVMGNL